MQVVSQEKWIAERRSLLEDEKRLLRLRDEVSSKRRSLPWVEIQKDYKFKTQQGEHDLRELFGQNSQLILYHFMFGDGWGEGCPSCSFWADSFDGMAVHLDARDASFVVASNAPLDQLLAYQERMGWNFNWVSSFQTDFNYDFRVSFSDEQIANQEKAYNYGNNAFPSKEAPGISVFNRVEDVVYHTYSCFSRGSDNMNPVYQYLDLLPKGRDEDTLPHPMSWVRRHDRYGS